MPRGSPDTPGEAPEGAGKTPDRAGDAWSEPGKAPGRAEEAMGTTGKGACTWHAPRGGSYLLPGRVVMAGEGAGVPGSGAGVVGGTTVALGRARNGWMPNSTSLSLPLP
jgi:hypothetical protein